MPIAMNLPKPICNHDELWGYLRSGYIAKRGNSTNPSGKVTPKTTYKDVYQILKCWEDKVWLAFLHHPFGHHANLTKMRDWNRDRERIYRDVLNAPKDAIYPLNEWFWHTVTKDIAAYLNANAVASQPSAKRQDPPSGAKFFGSLLGYGVFAFLDGRKSQREYEKEQRTARQQPPKRSPNRE